MTKHRVIYNVGLILFVISLLVIFILSLGFPIIRDVVRILMRYYILSFNSAIFTVLLSLFIIAYGKKK